MAKNKRSNLEPIIEIFDPVREIHNKFDLYIKFVVGILFVSMLIMLFMTATLIIDSSHFNSSIYKEYSSKYDTNNMLLEENKKMVETIKQNQETITKNQEAIDGLIKKLSK
jgi:hypothetical protein